MFRIFWALHSSEVTAARRFVLVRSVLCKVFVPFLGSAAGKVHVSTAVRPIPCECRRLSETAKQCMCHILAHFRSPSIEMAGVVDTNISIQIKDHIKCLKFTTR